MLRGTHGASNLNDSLGENQVLVGWKGYGEVKFEVRLGTDDWNSWKPLFYTPTLHTICAPTSQVVSRVRVQLLTIIDQDFFARDGKNIALKEIFLMLNFKLYLAPLCGYHTGSSNVWLGSTAKEFMVKVFSTLKVMVVVMMMVVDIMMMMLTTIMVMAVVIYNWRLWLPPAVVIAAFAQDLLFRCYVVICCSCYSVLIVGLERW